LIEKGKRENKGTDLRINRDSGCFFRWDQIIMSMAGVTNKIELIADIVIVILTQYFPKCYSNNILEILKGGGDYEMS